MNKKATAKLHSTAKNKPLGCSKCTSLPDSRYSFKKGLVSVPTSCPKESGTSFHWKKEIRILQLKGFCYRCLHWVLIQKWCSMGWHPLFTLDSEIFFLKAPQSRKYEVNDPSLWQFQLAFSSIRLPNLEIAGSSNWLQLPINLSHTNRPSPFLKLSNLPVTPTSCSSKSHLNRTLC